MSIKKNIIYSSILTVSSYLFPLITFPYVTRVLGVANYGICSFYDSIVGYFILFSMLGIVNLGIREIARVKDNKEELTKIFSALLSLNLITTAISIIALIIVGLSVPKLAEYPYMIYIGIGKVLVNSLLVEWFYKGIEDFKYITYRSIIVRSIYVLSVFIFVRERNDYIIYFGLTTLMFAVNSVINLYHLRKFIHVSTVSFRFKQFVKPYLILGAYQLLTSMYTSINVVILGFIAGDVQVGYYSTSVRLYTIIISFYTAFSGVLLPRMSSLVIKNDYNKFNHLISKSLAVLYVFSIPAIIITVFFAPTIINIIAGAEFAPAVIPMRIVMPLMLVIGMEVVLVYQILFPLRQDRAIFINSIIGAIVGLCLNFWLVPIYQSMGSAISWVGSEIFVLGSALYFVTRLYRFNFNLIVLRKIIICTIPIVSLYFLFGIPTRQNTGIMVITGAFTAVYYVIMDIAYIRVLPWKTVMERIKIVFK